MLPLKTFIPRALPFYAGTALFWLCGAFENGRMGLCVQGWMKSAVFSLDSAQTLSGYAEHPVVNRHKCTTLDSSSSKLDCKIFNEPFQNGKKGLGTGVELDKGRLGEVQAAFAKALRHR